MRDAAGSSVALVGLALVIFSCGVVLGLRRQPRWVCRWKGILEGVADRTWEEWMGWLREWAWPWVPCVRAFRPLAQKLELARGLAEQGSGVRVRVGLVGGSVRFGVRRGHPSYRVWIRAGWRGGFWVGGRVRGAGTSTDGSWRIRMEKAEDAMGRMTAELRRLCAFAETLGSEGAGQAQGVKA